MPYFFLLPKEGQALDIGTFVVEAYNVPGTRSEKKCAALTRAAAQHLSLQYRHPGRDESAGIPEEDGRYLTLYPHSSPVGSTASFFFAFSSLIDKGPTTTP